MLKCLIAVILGGVVIGSYQVALADDANRSGMHPIEDRTGILYDKVIDYLENMNAVQESRHCVLGKGSKKTIDGDEIKDVGLIKLLVVEPAKKQRLVATATIHDPLGRASERWAQVLEIDGATIVRNTSAGNPVPTDLRFDESTPEDEKPTIMVKTFTPFDDAVRMAHGLDIAGIWRPGFAESLLLTNGLKLNGADFDKEGNIVSKWQNQSAEITLLAEIVFGKQVGYQPVRTRYFVRRGEDVRLMDDIATSWEKHAKRWLPKKQEGAFLHISGMEMHYSFAYEWKLLDEFPKDLIVKDCNDWREPFRLLFKQEWVRPGRGFTRLPDALRVPVP